MKYYEITDPITGYVHVWGSEMQSEAEIREEWHRSLSPNSHAEQIEPRRIKVRPIARHELGTPEHEDLIRHPVHGFVMPEEVPALDEQVAERELRRQELERRRAGTE